MPNLWRAIRFTLFSVLLLGLIYPLAVAGIANVAFPFQANGSMVKLHGQIVGSRLIAQKVTDAKLFWPRPSATGYVGTTSGGSNYGPTSPALIKEIKKNIQSDGAPKGTPAALIPPDMVESSASGLDPDISIQNALLQVPRVSQATGLPASTLRALITRTETGRFVALWGEPMVNVLSLNLALLHELGQD